jgi:hypothetical protein
VIGKLYRWQGHSFDRLVVEWFYRCLGVSLLLMVGKEVYNQQWAVHASQLCGRRVFDAFLLYPPEALLLEWGVCAIAAFALIGGRQRAWAVRFACVAVWIGLTQRYMNQKALLGILLVYASLAPPDTSEEGFDQRLRPNLSLVRAQIVLVYLFSGTNKMLHGFFDGKDLTATFQQLTQLRAKAWIPAEPVLAALQASPDLAWGLSWLVLLVELVLPCLLVLRPRLGLMGVILLHLGFCLFMPGLWSFGATMVAGAVLFLALESSSSE